MHTRKTGAGRANEIRALKRMKESEIDTTEIPPIADWSKAIAGRFCRPIKKPLTIRLDADVLAWLRGQGRGYQTKINRMLRNAMESGESSKKQRFRFIIALFSAPGRMDRLIRPQTPYDRGDREAW